ncbi:MAG: bifunctional o-acetylhomoserine/o-acetylserine sulfhydrylase [Bifidobacteriaceae bacterium]|jgi:O-acetylhomoserine (thiol)-lyase|nr:bifunctional o-acetylhomoserine/o-acetylserine sulfhydrylase [Bifidobacteriaceae bacterium]
MSQQWSFETQQIHAGQQPDPGTGARALPIFQTTSYVFPSAATAAARFALQELGPIYTRLTNPTQEVVENRIAALEGGAGGLLTASGAAATTLAILNIAGAGDHIVSAASLYGGTYSLLRNTLPRFGITTSFVDDPTDLDQWRAAIRPNTKALFGETIPNPKTDVLDVEGIAAVAHQAALPLLVDNTVATPYLLRPVEWGADVVIHSATKYLGGHGNSIGGAIVDAGRFDYAKAGKFPGFTTPDPAYNGLVFGEVFGPGGVFGANLSYILKARAQLLRDLGPAIAPFNAFLLAQGIETLSLRIERHVDNALAVARWLEARPDVRLVHYAGLESSPYHQLAQKYTPRGPGAVLAFEVAGGAPAGQAFVSALKLHSNVANIGDVRSLVIHPASTTHSQLNPAEQALSAVTPGLVRLAVGLEGIGDILADLELGFAAANAAAA